MAAIIDAALFLGFCYVILWRIPKAIVEGIRAFRGKRGN